MSLSVSLHITLLVQLGFGDSPDILIPSSEFDSLDLLQFSIFELYIYIYIISLHQLMMSSGCLFLVLTLYILHLRIVQVQVLVASADFEGFMSF